MEDTGVGVPEEAPSLAPASRATTGARLLIVEDHPLNQKVLCGFLNPFGLGADTASGGQRPIIVGVTADAMQGTREKCLGAGMNDMITKPIMTEELHRVLSRWLRAAKPAPGQATVKAFSSQWVDVRHLREMDEWIRTYDPGFWERAQVQFRGSADRLLVSMREAHQAGQSRDATEAGYALKGLCLMMGLSRMGEACGKLETLGIGDDGAEWGEHLQETESFMEPSLLEMRKQVGKA